MFAIYAAVGFSTGLIHFAPRSIALMPVVAVSALFAPAIGEELVFRAALIPGRSESAGALGWILVSTALFTVWHLVESAFLAGAATLFRRIDFLALAATLGFVCAVLRRRSGSVWPPVVLHWAVVVAWLGWFGGPSLAELR